MRGSKNQSAEKKTTGMPDGVNNRKTKTLFTLRDRRLFSAAIYFFQLAGGCCDTFLAPTIVDFSQKFNTSVSQVSVVFTMQTVAYLLSALAGGFVFNVVDREILSIFLMGVVSLGLYIIPHTHNMYVFYMCGAFIGLGAGGYDSAQITWLCEIYPRAPVAPFIFFFAYSVGTMISPLLLEPFLHDNIKDNDTFFRSTTPGQISLDTTEIDRADDFTGGSDLLIPFTVAASIMAAATLIQTFLCFQLRTKTWKTEAPPSEEQKSDEGHSQGHDSAGPVKLTRQAGRWRWVFLVVLCCCFVGFYQGLQIIALQFLTTYTYYSPLHLPKAEGAQLVFGMTAAFAVARGLGILVVFKVPLPWLLYTNFALIFVSNVMLLVWGLENLTTMWIACVLFGVGMSTVTSAFWAYIKKYLEMTNFVVCITVVAGGVVGSIYPIFIGRFIEELPAILNYTIFTSGGAVLLAFLLIQAVTEWGWGTRQKGERGQDGQQVEMGAKREGVDNPVFSMDTVL